MSDSGNHFDRVSDGVIGGKEKLTRINFLNTGYERIYLIGFMGSGKSTLGKKLALKLGYDFLDTDKEIERQTGRTIAELFDGPGEARFRELESEVLHQTLDRNRLVVATGGGLPCFGKNMEVILANGLSIYLEADPLFLVNRITPGKARRPLLAGLDGPELEKYVTEKLNSRKTWYLRAAVHFKVPSGSLETLVKSIVSGD